MVLKPSKGSHYLAATEQMVNTDFYKELKAECDAGQVALVAVSKTKPIEDIQILYDLGQRDFGENYVQELLDKQAALPKDIRWHFIGHLQSNKVKQLVPFIHLIHSVDTIRLLQEIDKQASKASRSINCLLQMHIAQEETKYGMDEREIGEAMQLRSSLQNVDVQGLMGMASFTDNTEQVQQELNRLKTTFDQYFQPSDTLSMGMSGDYKMAIEQGSNMIRVGSLLFGARQ